MIQEGLRSILNYVLLKRSFTTDRKILVLESDDWGTIRMSSKEAYQQLIKEGFPVDKCIYGSNDTLETGEDLQELFSVLSSISNREGKNPIMTLNTIVANPDFQKMRNFDYTQYHWEPFTTTLKRLQGDESTWKVYGKGLSENLIKPQFHGREHININRWMEALNSESNDVIRKVFEMGMFTIHTGINPSCRNEYLDAFGYGYIQERESHSKIASEGLSLFESIWGFKSQSFIAPCYIWSTQLESTLVKAGVQFIQGTSVQRNALKGSNRSFKRTWHYTGQANEHNQIFLVRNVLFEPSENKLLDWCGMAFEETKKAFSYGLPAIVSTHRVNYMGSLNSENRASGLRQLTNYLKKVIRTWPDIEFLSTDQLGAYILERRNN